MPEHATKTYVDSVIPEPIYCRIDCTTAQSITANSATPINFDTAVTDPYGLADLPNDAIVVEEAGIYFATASVEVSASANRAVLYVDVDGVHQLYDDRSHTGVLTPKASGLLNLTVGQVIKVLLYLGITRTLGVEPAVPNGSLSILKAS